ncbi:MAG: hypothetical protein ABII89_03075 [Candidatus Omnitrophota bacterium]
MKELGGLSGVLISILPVILFILIFWLVMRFLTIKYIGKEWYEREVISRLLVMGFVSGVVGRHVQIIFLIPQLVHKITAYQLFLSVLFSGGIGAGIALLFPLWQKYIKIRSFLLQSLIFWFLIPVLLGIGQLIIFVGYRAMISVIKLLQLDRLFLNAIATLAAGVCFYLLGILLRFDKYLKTSSAPER